MLTASFAVTDPDPENLRFPLKRLPGIRTPKINPLLTLLQLSELDASTPLLLEETYLQERDGLNLLLHLRLEPGLAISRAPVFIRLNRPVEEHIRHHAKYAVLCTKGVKLLRADEEPRDTDARSLTETEHLQMLEAIVTEAPGTSHDQSNEWGPHRLWKGYARLAGLREEPAWVQDAFFSLRQREHYAHLLGIAALRSGSAQNSEATGSEALSDYESFLASYEGPPLRVLLLDDEIAKGWGEAVTTVLGREGKLTVDASLAGIDFDAESTRVEATVDEGWDLVLADLRTSTKDRSGTPSRGALQYSGADWIRRIKKNRPDTAVVAFTASNKVWSVRDLREFGTDGYWLKESPAFGVNESYSQANAARLLSVVCEALEARVDARPVWGLQTDFDRLRRDRSANYEQGWADSMNRHSLDVVPRLEAIDERLRRAYGFLVMKRSEHEENEFAMRRYDLAFLSLWSVINEAVYLYFYHPQKDPSYTWGGALDKAYDAEFALRNPSTKEKETYWHLKRGKEVVRPTSVPGELVDAICPGSSRSTRQGATLTWPWGRFETASITWLLSLSGEKELARRFDDREYRGRPGLRELRNKLEYEHGRLGDQEEATLDDVHALCDVWRALFVNPYA